ncbi:hypothetical protein PLCT2_02467 [Planctomycetaceae bacterium]|nr:hypothetical protein PLCT2_02467 [Planctomycetaceae bacterium]
MDWREKLRSFPVIALGVIVLALIVGVILGLMGPSARPLPVSAPQGESSEGRAPGVKSGKADPVRTGAGSPSGPDSTGAGGSRPLPTRDKPRDTRETPRNSGVSTGGQWSRPKELKPGRKDTMAARVDVPVAQSSLLVTVKTQGEYAAQQATLLLDIQAEGLGWQRVSAKAQPTGNQGEWRYSGLFAGTYLVTAIVPGYNYAYQTVLVPGGMQEIGVRIDVPPAQYGRIALMFTFEDGGRPTMVYCLRADKGGREGALAGRFGRQEAPTSQQGAISGGLGNYAIPSDTQTLLFAVLADRKEHFTFSAMRDTRRYSAQMTIAGKLNEEQQFDVTLKLLDAAEPDPTGGHFAKEAVKAEFTFTRSDNAAVTLRRCNLRQSPDSPTYTAASTIEGNKATFLAMQPGNYFLVAEADGLSAAYVRSLTVTAGTDMPLLIEVTSLTLRVTRDQGIEPPPGLKWTYRATLRPLASGSIETFYNREIPAGASSDSTAYTVPVGSYTVVMGSTNELLACEAPSTPITLTRDGAALSFTLRTASTLEFVCIDSYMNPVPGVEFLVSYSPAGQIPESEKSRVELGASDGRCILKGATYGRVYLHVWVASSDFQAPDRTYEIDLPSYGVLNLGAVTVK